MNSVKLALILIKSTFPGVFASRSHFLTAPAERALAALLTRSARQERASSGDGVYKDNLGCLAPFHRVLISSIWSLQRNLWFWARKSDKRFTGVLVFTLNGDWLIKHRGTSSAPSRPLRAESNWIISEKACHEGWKRPLRSSSPAANPTPPCLLNQMNWWTCYHSG